MGPIISLDFSTELVDRKVVSLGETMAKTKEKHGLMAPCEVVQHRIKFILRQIIIKKQTHLNYFSPLLLPDIIL